MTSAPTARSAGRDPGERGDAEFPGVLAALAVDELRTASGDRVHERLYLEGLAQDFDRTANDIVGVTNTYEATLAYGDLVLPVLRRETLIVEWKPRGKLDADAEPLYETYTGAYQARSSRDDPNVGT